MKVYVCPTSMNGALAHHILREGDEVVVDPKDADVIIPELAPLPQEWFPFSLYESAEYDFFVTMIFDGERFTDQILVGVPLIGLGNDGMGPQVPMGSVLCFVEKLDILLETLQADKVETVLRLVGYTGPISWCFSSDLKLSGIVLSLPSFGLYALLEGRRQTIGDFFSSPLQIKESWSSALLLVRHPYPDIQQSKTPVTVLGIVPDLEKHFYMFRESGSHFDQQVWETCLTQLGVCTSWSTIGLLECNRRVLGSLSGLMCREKQYRTDPSTVVKRVLGPLLDSGFLKLRLPRWKNYNIPTNVDHFDSSRLLKGVEKNV